MDGAKSSENGVGFQHESDTPDTQPDTAQAVRGIKALAAALGVNRSTVYEWLKLSGHPGGSQATGYDVEAWREFARQIGSKTGAGQSEGKTALQEEELRLKNARLRSRIEQENGEWTRNDDFIPRMREVINGVKYILRSKLERELPLLYSTDPAVQEHARKLNQDAVDELCEHIQNLGELLNPGE